MKNSKIIISFILGVVLSCLVSLAITTQKVNNENDLVFSPPDIKRTLTPEQAESVISIINTEGLDYAFNHYSTYRDVTDVNFHNLRKNYVEAATELLKYLQESSENPTQSPFNFKY